MSDSKSSEHYSPEPNLLERKAAAYLQSRHQAEDAGEPPTQQAAPVRRVHRWAVIWAAVAGIVSGGIIGGSELLLHRWVPGDLEDMGWRAQVPYWAGLFAFAGLISGIEILFLYWNALKAIAKVRRIAGSPVESHHARLITLGLARAGLEFPSPRVIIYGIDPYARMPNWRLTVQSILYRMKVGVSTFAIRILVRRVFGRMVVRGILPLLAGPLYAIWNAIITWRIIREAEIRAFGPAAVAWIIECLDAQRQQLSRPAVELIIQGVGELIMRGYDAHPNYVLLLARLMETWEIEGDSVDVDWPSHDEQLKGLSADEQKVVLDVLTVATLLGSKVRSPQKEFLGELYADCGATLNHDGLDRLRTRLMDGQPITPEDLQAVRS
jgi:hypothetical protein